MKIKKMTIIAILVGVSSWSSIAAADSLEGALTELKAISSGMSPAEVQQKIQRFIERAPQGTDVNAVLSQYGLSDSSQNGNGNGNNGNGNGNGGSNTPTNYDKQQDTKISAAQTTADQAKAGLAGKVSNADFAADQARQDANLDKTNQDLANESDVRSQNDQLLKDQIDTKVSQADYDSGQQAQNEHITAVEGAAQTANDRATNLETRADSSEQAIRDTQGAAQTANDRATALESRSDAVEAKNGQQDATLADHDTRITSNTNALTTKVDKQVFADDQARQDAALKSETTTRASQVAKLQSGVDQAQATGDYANSRIDVANQNIEANRQASIATNKRVAANTAQLANHEQRITTLEQNTSARFSDLNSKIDDNRKRASAGIAGVAAMANIPQVTNTQTFSVGAGVGNTDSESALAVGFSARASENWVVKASVSNDTQHNFVVGAGASYGW